MDKDKEIYSINEVVEKCHNFCVIVGPELLYNIPDPVNFHENNVRIERNSCSMFFMAVNEKEIIDNKR